jgi:hypothetical protein
MFVVEILPDSKIHQSFGIVHVIHQKTQVRILKIAWNQTSKSLLPSRIPQLQSIMFVLIG